MLQAVRQLLAVVEASSSLMVNLSIFFCRSVSSHVYNKGYLNNCVRGLEGFDFERMGFTGGVKF